MRTRRLLAVVVSSLLLGGAASGQEPEGEPAAKPTPIEDLLAGYRNAPEEERPQWLHRLCKAGPDALEATRASHGAETDEELRAGLARALRWQLADKIVPVLRAGIETQLTFDGQYSSLSELGAGVVDSLFALVEDDTADPEIRLAASRALADVGDQSMLPRLRELHYDILLPAFLREQLGILMATLGDTHTIDRQIVRMKELAESEDPMRRELGNRELANLYYRIRNYGEAVACYERLLEIWEAFYRAQEAAGVGGEDLEGVAEVLALHYYNAACSSSLALRFDQAKEYLRKAIKLHAIHLENIAKDGDLAPLRAEKSYPEFRKELEAMFDDLSI